MIKVQDIQDVFLGFFSSKANSILVRSKPLVLTSAALGTPGGGGTGKYKLLNQPEIVGYSRVQKT